MPLVILIWGYLIYKIVLGFSGNDSPINITQKRTESIETQKKYIEKQDTFSLEKIHRDPFLNILYRVNKTKTAKKQFQKEKLEWPSVIYKGLVSNVKGKKSIALIKIEGKQFFFQEGENNMDCKLIFVSENKITLLYKSKKKSFVKQ